MLSKISVNASERLQQPRRTIFSPCETISPQYTGRIEASSEAAKEHVWISSLQGLDVIPLDSPPRMMEIFINRTTVEHFGQPREAVPQKHYTQLL